jgi:hypothetical protein
LRGSTILGTGSIITIMVYRSLASCRWIHDASLVDWAPSLIRGPPRALDRHYRWRWNRDRNIVFLAPHHAAGRHEIIAAALDFDSNSVEAEDLRVDGSRSRCR